MIIRNDCEIHVKCAFGDILEPGDLTHNENWLNADGLHENKYRTVLQEVLVKEDAYMIAGGCPFKHIINYKMEFDGPFDKEQVELPEEYNEPSPYVGIAGGWTGSTTSIAVSAVSAVSGVITPWLVASPTWMGTPPSYSSITWGHSSSSSTIPLTLGSGNMYSVSYSYGA